MVWTPSSAKLQHLRKGELYSQTGSPSITNEGGYAAIMTEVLYEIVLLPDHNFQKCI